LLTSATRSDSTTSATAAKTRSIHSDCTFAWCTTSVKCSTIVGDQITTVMRPQNRVFLQARWQFKSQTSLHNSKNGKHSRVGSIGFGHRPYRIRHHQIQDAAYRGDLCWIHRQVSDTGDSTHCILVSDVRPAFHSLRPHRDPCSGDQ